MLPLLVCRAALGISTGAASPLAGAAGGVEVSTASAGAGAWAAGLAAAAAGLGVGLAGGPATGGGAAVLTAGAAGVVAGAVSGGGMGAGAGFATASFVGRAAGAVNGRSSTMRRSGLVSVEVVISTGPVRSSTMRVTPGSVSATRTPVTSLSSKARSVKAPRIQPRPRIQDVEIDPLGVVQAVVTELEVARYLHWPRGWFADTDQWRIAVTERCGAWAARIAAASASEVLTRVSTLPLLVLKSANAAVRFIEAYFRET